MAVTEGMAISIRIIFEYDLGTREIDGVIMPFHQCPILLTATECGRLGFAALKDSSLILCSREEATGGPLGLEVNRIVELAKLLPANTRLISVAGFVHGLEVFFMRTDDGLFSIDLMSGQMKKVCEGSGFNYVVPYMSFCTAALGATTSAGERPSAGASSA